MELLRRIKPASLVLDIVGLGFFLLGLGGYTFVYARGTSYLSDDPNTCVNCHVMREQFDAWRHSSHGRVAVCNDCHTPHSSVVEKWVVKGINGFNHSVAFTLQSYPENIRIKGFNADVVQANCVGCHENLTHFLTLTEGSAPNCLTCHTGIGHRTRK